MSTALATRGASGVSRAPNPSGLADVVDLILDKGLVIDVYVRVSLVGIELLTIDARIVVASVDTYLRFAEAVNRLDLSQTDAVGIKDLGKGGDDDEDDDDSGRGEAGTAGQIHPRQSAKPSCVRRRHPCLVTGAG